jgi:hypothetical protein
LETNPYTLAFARLEVVMDMYTLGRLALPVVIGIIAVCAVLTLIMGIFAILKTLKSTRRFSQTPEMEQRPSLRIYVFTRRLFLKPPMREHD